MSNWLDRAKRALESGSFLAQARLSCRPNPYRRKFAFEELEPRLTLAAVGLITTPQTYSGTLNGKIVFTSGGHGWRWSTTLGRYATDRGDNNEIVEDFGNQEQMTFYADYLLRAGATVVPMRPVGRQINEVVLDNDSAGVTFSARAGRTAAAHGTTTKTTAWPAMPFRTDSPARSRAPRRRRPPTHQTFRRLVSIRSIPGCCGEPTARSRRTASTIPAAPPRFRSITARWALAGCILARTISTRAAPQPAKARLSSATKRLLRAKSSSPMRSASATAWATGSIRRAPRRFRLSARRRKFVSLDRPVGRRRDNADDGNRVQQVITTFRRRRILPSTCSPARLAKRCTSASTPTPAADAGPVASSTAVRRRPIKRARTAWPISWATRSTRTCRISTACSNTTGRLAPHRRSRAVSARSTWAHRPRWTPRSSKWRSTIALRTRRSCAIRRAAIRSPARRIRERCNTSRCTVVRLQRTPVCRHRRPPCER